MTVCDSVTGDQPALARFIVHPGLELVHSAENDWRIQDGAALIAAITVTDGRGEIRDAQYAPQFGKRLATQCLAVALVNGRSQVTFDWSAAS